jgi:hypothetical protein
MILVWIGLAVLAAVGLIVGTILVLKNNPNKAEKVSGVIDILKK